VGRRRGARDTVTLAETGDALSESDDLARHLVPQHDGERDLEGEVTLDVRDVAVADPGATYLHEDLARSRLRDRPVGQPERGAGFVEQPSLHGILHRKWGGVSGYPSHCHVPSGASRDSCPGLHAPSLLAGRD